MSVSILSHRARVLGLAGLVVVMDAGAQTVKTPDKIDPATLVAPEREGMVLVPTGEFKMGSATTDQWADNDEFPQRIVAVPAFYIDELEVSNLEYKRFIDAVNWKPPPPWTDRVYPHGSEFLPVTDVTWWDACAYAQWAGKRLPTEIEWEKAARGTDARRFPWGDEFSADRANDSQSLMPAGSYPNGVSPYGVFDMSGNVAEWTATPYEPYPHPEAVLPTDFGGTSGNRPMEEIAPPASPPPKSNVKIKKNDPRLRFFTVEMLQDTRPRVYRGGSYNSYARFLRCAQRQKEDPNGRWQNLGFRCAADVTPAPAPAPAPKSAPTPSPGTGAGEAR